MKSTNETMMQYFEWYLPNNCSLWKNIIKTAPQLKKMGITSVWLPPCFKSAGGIDDTGYGIYDLYDLGEFNQKGNIRTKYGTKDEYIAAIRSLQVENIKVLADIVLNHRMGADEKQDIIAYKIDPDDRTKTLGDYRTISAWTKYNFEGRNNTYSDFKLDWSHFTAIDYDDIAKEYLNGRLLPSREELLGKMTLEKAWQQSEDGLVNMACYMAYTALVSREPLCEALKETDMWRVYTEIELPLIFTLNSMEKWGIKVKGEELKSYGERLNIRIAELEQLIWKQAGEEFNINSPKQMGIILFEKLGLKGGKKTKTGYSTAADILEKLAPEYPIVKDILEYRQLTKLKSTYGDGLEKVIERDGRIHSTFNQTITATGRISSTEPNLQNIPVRMELGRLIRKVFVPEDEYVFLDADYSQIELRVLAHMSGDEKLIQAYREAQDIHRLTASQVFHVPFDQVTPLQRRNAKAVNFGIVYGISSFGLSQDLSITRKEAADYIERYFETYPKIKGFLDELVEQGKKKGYVTTMFGRRRPIPELKSSNFMQRSFGERVAMNSPIQGTAADIIKIAMNRVYKRLKEEGLRSRLVLQVHDELLIETYKEEIEQVSAILEEEMKGAANLSVELEVDMHQGNNWYEAK